MASNSVCPEFPVLDAHKDMIVGHGHIPIRGTYRELADLRCRESVRK